MKMLVLRLFCLSFLLPSTMAAWVGSSSKKVLEILSSGSQLYVGGDFLSQNSQHLGQQVAILNALTLAKSGKTHEAKKEIELMAVSISLYDLPNTLRQGVSLVKSMLLEDPGALPKTMNAGKKHLKVMNHQLEIAVNDFSTRYPNPTPDNLAEMRTKVNDILARPSYMVSGTRDNPPQGYLDRDDKASKQSRQSVLTALEQDFKRMEVLSTDTTNRLRKSRFTKIKTWYEHLKKNKVKKFLGNRVGDIGVLDPIVDFIGAALSINGLVIAVRNDDDKSITINSIALVASVVGVISWFLVAGGVAFAGPINVAVGLIAAIATVFINLFWPSNPTIDIANKFSKQAIEDLTANMEALKDPSYRSSFGWVFQANTGVFLIGSNIRPSHPITFRQPACTSESASTTPCDPNTKEFHSNKYLVVGKERESSDNDFPLDVTSDFLGRPKTERFCGNTICLNAVSYYKTLSRRSTGVSFPHVRSLTIDTTNVPEYNKVDVSSFQPTSRDVQHNVTSVIRDESKKSKAKKLSAKNERGSEKSKEKVIKRSDSESAEGSMGCNPNSDRIEIDELRRFEPGYNKKVHIRTGVGKDILSIGGLIGEPNDGRTNILDGDLGVAKGEPNVFSVGYLLDTDRGRSDLIGGVKFDNIAGEGRVCYLKRDLVTWRCVGKVRGVNIFKGSRFHDTVILGGHGPRTVIQHYGANEYNFRIDDVKSVLDGRDAETDMCPEHGKWDWGHYRVGDQDYCYTVIQNLKSTWEDAQAMCNELGAGLVTIHSEEENIFVANFRPGVGKGRWLGLTTNYKGGSFRWLDGSEMGEPPYLNFRKPGLYRDPITSVTCIYMLTEGEWWWSRCCSRLSFTCKKPATEANGCGNQWRSYNVLRQPYCYKAFGVSDESQRKSFSDAVSYCQSQGASLTSIMNEEEQTFLLGLNRRNQWIGLDDGWGYRKFYWSDGQPLGSGGTGSKWTEGEPNNENYQEHCVLLEGTKWKDWNCEEEKRFTCEKQPGNSQGGLQCPDNWNLHCGSCLLGVSSAKTWPEAEVYCKEQDAVLVKADSEAKIIAVRTIQGSEASWIGLRDDKYNLKYRWFDGSDFDYTNWDSEKPSEYSRKHCAIMIHGSGGKWIPYYCKHALWRNPACKKKATARMNYEITDTSKDGRPLVKVVIPDNMPQATVRYDQHSMVIHVKDPSLGWVARIVFIRDLPFGPHVYQVKNNRETRVGHTALE